MEVSLFVFSLIFSVSRPAAEGFITAFIYPLRCPLSDFRTPFKKTTLFFCALNLSFNIAQYYGLTYPQDFPPP